MTDNHLPKDCLYAPEEPGPSGRPTQAGAPRGAGPRSRSAQGSSVEICQLYNRLAGNACRYKQCRYAHICATCRRGGHPASECEGHATSSGR